MPAKSLIERSALLAGLLAFGCFPPDDGRDPPLNRIYFPVGLALNSDGTRLYVANSDFDLQFNAGSLQVYDVDALRAYLPNFDNPEPCATVGGEKTPAERLIAPGRCRFLDPVSPPGGGRVLIDAVEIGAFVTDVIFRPWPSGESLDGDAGTVPLDGGQSMPGEQAPTRRGRLFLPVRGDATLHWVDVSWDSGEELDCGQGSGRECDDNHRRGDDAQSENTRDQTLPAEPYGIAADHRGETIVTTHQINGAAALFLNDWENGATGGPRLKHVLGGLPTGVVGVAAVPGAGEPRYFVTFRDAAQVSMLLAFTDEEVEGSPASAFLVDSARVPINAISQGFHSRGIAVDDSARRECESTCSGEDACLRECANTPLGVFVSNRAPASLIVGRTNPVGNDLPVFGNAIHLAPGPSRVVVGDVIGKDGRPQRRVFVLCFDSRNIYVYDPKAGEIETRIFTGRGPHALAVDSKNGLGFVGHFTDSYVGVVDLDQRHPHYGEIILTVGEPIPPRASK